MKKLILILLVLAVMVGTCAYTMPRSERLWTKKQEVLHVLAETAREMGLSEDNAIIVEAKRLWMQEEEDKRIITKVLLNEAPWPCTDRHQQMVAAVICNRVERPLFPDNVRDVVNAPGQYSTAYTRNLPETGDADEQVQRAFRNAIAAMNGEVDCPEDVVYQSEFDFCGSGIYEQIEVRTDWFYSVTYFNYE